VTTAFSYSPYSDEVRDNPYPLYRVLRAEHPCYYNEELNLWALSRFQDVFEVVRDPATFSSVGAITLQDNAMTAFPMIITTDPPQHTRLRGLVNRAFTPRRVAALEPHIREITRELIRDFLPSGSCDFVRDLSGQLPVIVIAEMLGIPTEDRFQFREWSNRIVAIDTRSAASIEQATEAMIELFGYLDEVIQERQKDPRDDLISALCIARDGDHSLDSEELLSVCGVLLLAGNETTANSIASSAFHLATHPEQRAKLLADPTIMPRAVEELLRFDSPVQAVARITTREVEIHGQRIPKGGRIGIIFGSALHDEREYDEPDQLDVTRDIERTLTFGNGIHYCLGAALGRLETRIAIEELLSVLPDYEVDASGAERYSTGMIRGLSRLPMTFDPDQAAVPV
jgi:cytochrome P450